MKNADKPAYPFVPNSSQFIVDPEVAYGESGMSKREMFAMAAMQGLISSHPDQAHNHGQGATVAVQWADALLKALEP